LVRSLLRFAVCLAIALPVVALLPIYARRSLVRSQMDGHAGDVIDWTWSVSTLPGFFDALQYMRPEEYPLPTTAMNLAIWLVLASGAALAANRLWTRLRK
jgi:hypothetical protein